MLFEDLLADASRLDSDAAARVEIQIQVDEKQSVTLSLEECVSILGPALAETFGGLQRYRRVPKVVLPKTELFSASALVREDDIPILMSVLEILSRHPKEMFSLVEKLQGSKVELFADALLTYSFMNGTSQNVLSVSLEREFSERSRDKGSILRGATFAVAMMKYFSMGFEFTKYRETILVPLLSAIIESNSLRLQEPQKPGELESSRGGAETSISEDMFLTLRMVLEGICSESSLNAMPWRMRYICHCLVSLGDQVGLSQGEKDGQLSGFLILRFFNPAILAPTAAGIIKGPLRKEAAANLKVLARVLQKISLGLASEEAGGNLYPLLQDYFRQVVQDPSGDQWSTIQKRSKTADGADLRAVVESRCAHKLMECLSTIPEYVRSRVGAEPWTSVWAYTQMAGYLTKMQLWLQSEETYLQALEGLEDLLRQIVTACLVEGDRSFAVFFAGLAQVSQWHQKMYYVLHHAIPEEWLFVNSLRQYFHLIVLEIQAVYFPLMDSFPPVYRILLDLARDAARGKHAPEVRALIERALSMIGRPFKRISDIMASASSLQPPDNHEDKEVLQSFLKYGRHIYDGMRDSLNFSAYSEIGELELKFTEPLDLAKPSRNILRHAVFQDATQSVPNSQVEVWLFNDMILCAARTGQEYLRLWSQLLSLISLRPTSSEDCALVLVVATDQKGRRGSMSSKDTREYRLVATSAKVKNSWAKEIEDSKVKFSESTVGSRALAAGDLLPPLSAGDWDLLFKGAQLHSCKAGEVILSQRDVNAKFFRVASGQVRLCWKLREQDLEVAIIRAGEVFGINSLLGADMEVSDYHALAVTNFTKVEGVSASQVRLATGQDELLKRRLYVSLARAQEATLNNVRRRYGKARSRGVLVGVLPSTLTIASLVATALAEMEKFFASGDGAPASSKSYQRADVAQLLLGIDSCNLGQRVKQFSSFGAASKWPLQVDHWLAILGAMDTDKFVQVGRDGATVLTKTGKLLASPNVDLSSIPHVALKACVDSFFQSGRSVMETQFGLKHEIVLGNFAISAKAFDSLFLSQHYVALSGKPRLGAEQVKCIHLGQIRLVEQKKKVLEVSYNSIKHADKISVLKISFKSPSDVQPCQDLLTKLLDELGITQQDSPLNLSSSLTSSRGGILKILGNPKTGGSEAPQVTRSGVTVRIKDKGASSVLSSLLEICPIREMGRNESFTSTGSEGDVGSSGPVLCVAQDNTSVHCCARSLQGQEYCLRTIDAGTIFAPDPAFFGGAGADNVIVWRADANAPKTTIREISMAVLAEAKPEQACICLRWLLQEQLRELAFYSEHADAILQAERPGYQGEN